MGLTAEQRQAVVAAARAKGVSEEAALAEAEKLVGDDGAEPDSSGAPVGAQAERPKIFAYHLPYIRVRELRAYLGFTEPLPDQDLTCGEFSLKYGAPAPAAAASDE